MDEQPDQQIVEAVLTGDANAYRVLVQRYQKPLFNLFYRMTDSYEDSLDLAQETFIKAYEKLESFKMGSRFFPWIYTIGLNHGRNFLRRSRKENQTFCEMGEEESWVDCSRQEETIDAACLRQSLLQLPLEYREAVMLHFHEGLSMEEIARALELSVSGAKMRVHRGLRKLRQLLGGHQEEERRGANERKSHAANG